MLITTTDTYRLYISNTFYCNKQWECNSNNNKRSAGCVSDWKPSDFLSFCLCLCVYLFGLKGFTVGEEEISDNWYFRECGLFAPQPQTLWIFDISVGVCVCVWFLLFAVCLRETRKNLFPLAEIKCKQIEKLFFFLCLFLLIKLCFFLSLLCVDNLLLLLLDYYLWDQKRSLQKKKENVGFPALLSLFCFVLLDFCCRKSREPKVFGSFNSANITNDNLHFHSSLRYQRGINQ